MALTVKLTPSCIWHTHVLSLAACCSCCHAYQGLAQLIPRRWPRRRRLTAAAANVVESTSPVDRPALGGRL